jgi:hypothetical protein
MGDEQMKLWEDKSENNPTETIIPQEEKVIEDQENPKVVPEKYASEINQLWQRMDRIGGMELRQVLDTLKYITSEDLTYGQISKYLKYCKIEKKSSGRNKYLPGRNEWKLSIPELTNRSLKTSTSQKEVFTFSQAVHEALERKENEEENNNPF